MTKEQAKSYTDLFEKINYGYNVFCTHVLDLPELMTSFGRNDGPKKRKTKETIKSYWEEQGFHSKGTREKFNAWYKDKLTPMEKLQLGVSRVPVIGGIVNILAYPYSKVNAYLRLARNDVQIENVQDYSKSQLNELSKIANRGFDTEQLQDPKLSPAEMRVAVKYLRDKDFVFTSENIRERRERDFLADAAGLFYPDDYSFGSSYKQPAEEEPAIKPIKETTSDVKAPQKEYVSLDARLKGCEVKRDIVNQSKWFGVKVPVKNLNEITH